MSKNFPYIRYHGNAKAGFRHTKRGLYELGRAEDLQQRMGVSIYKRSVEVNEYTTITVEISMEQTFVHIYSNPPSLPEVVPPPPVKEEPKESGCPSAFLIRSVPKGTADILDDDAQNGYLIGYNHSTGKWRVVRIYNDGETLADPKAGNIGWYHAKDSENGVFSRCDMVTWFGQYAPDFKIAFLPGRTSGAYSPATLLKKRVYFQGREHTTSNYVIGACILKALDDQNVLHDYMYTHEVFLVERDANSGIRSMRINFETFKRKKLNNFIAETGTWETVRSVSAADFADELRFNLPVLTTPYFDHPRTTAHVSADGFSYVTREYYGENVGQSPDILSYNEKGYTAFIKFDMRSGGWEILSSTETNAPLFRINHSWSGEDSTPSPGSGTYSDGTRPYEASLHIESPEPWTFYVWPGTEDLYTLSLAHRYDVSSHDYRDIYLTDPVIRYLQSGAGFCAGETRLLVHKNGSLISDEVILDIYADTSYAWVTGTGDPGYLVAEQSGFTRATSISFYEWHPEIKNSRHTFTYNVSQAGSENPEFTTVVWDDGSEVEQIYSYDRVLDLTEATVPVPRMARNCGLEGRGTQELAYEYAEQRYDRGATINRYNNYGGNDSMGFRAEDWLPAVTTLAGGLNFATTGPPIIADGSLTEVGFQFGTEDHRNMATETQVIDNRRVTGGANNFIVPTYTGDPDDDTHWWPASSYAIHRTFRGMKPYLWLRKKVYPSSSFNVAMLGSTADEATLNHNIITVADDDPGLVWPTGYDNPGIDQKPVILYSKPGGSFYNEDRDDRNWNDNEWVLESNFISAKELNKITKEIGNAFFSIGII